ncbi:hypothetical protein DMC14_000375 [Metamycoplasma phocicerebrale]|uniref:Uncharacterized protein n=1 Tax=Metamycoplasma phocicerebrale TaxID=142649 RepID=A0A3Q9V532_9BACT|nr:hypothetical protein [Metamycoplasma phocicerebrale]AZZ65263.1 hypothetical protein DMC14_000375 [Metamycoplasma phocicerebrale]
MSSYLEKYRLYFITKSLNSKESNSAKARGYIDIFMEDNDWLIEGININFDYLEIDQYTTPSWFIKKNINFKTREKLFSKINLKQEKRPSTSSNKTIILNKEQINIVNKFFNEDYFSNNKTIKNIISILKGNNAGGSLKNPKNAEMIIDLKYKRNIYKYEKYKFNLFMVLDLIIKNQKHEKEIRHENYKIYNENLNEKDYYDFLDKFFNETNFSYNSNFKNFKELIEIANIQNKNEVENNIWINKCEELKKLLGSFKNFRENYIDNKINTLRAKASQERINVFEFENSYRKRNFETQNAHIYDVKYIRQDLEEFTIKERKKEPKITNEKIANKFEFNEILSKVCNKNNLLNLSLEMHWEFDKNSFTYQENGKIKILKQDFILEEYEKCFSEIPNNKLNKEMINFIIQRNQKRQNK